MVYQYTKPRGPVAAAHKGPGPCYGLPCLTGQPNHDPRSNMQKNPAFYFGVRHGKLTEDCSPGPAYLPEHKVYKDGKDGTPHYSIYGRHRDLAMFKTPGPGTYSMEKSGQMTFHREPAYTFGSRMAKKAEEKTPAPNSYTLDSMLTSTVRSSKKQAPVYSMTGRSNVGSFYEDLTKTPGPGAYGITQPGIYKNKMPSYSMTAHNTAPGDATKKPGPGAHSPEKVTANRKAAPQYSFGIRHSEYITPLIVEPSD